MNRPTRMQVAARVRQAKDMLAEDPGLPYAVLAARLGTTPCSVSQMLCRRGIRRNAWSTAAKRRARNGTMNRASKPNGTITLPVTWELFGKIVSLIPDAKSARLIGTALQKMAGGAESA
jgi:hypothetical protein